MLCLVLDELFEASLPRHGRDCLFQRPIKADDVEPLDAISLKRTGHVAVPLCAHPRSEFSLPNRNVAVAVLRFILISSLKRAFHCSRHLFASTLCGTSSSSQS